MSVRFAAFLLVVLALGCDHITTRPAGPGTPSLQLALSSPTGDPGHPVTITARVTNVGSQPIRYSLQCGTSGPLVLVRAPDRANIVDVCAECPDLVCLRCPDQVVLLGLGENIACEVVFDGTLLQCDGPYQGPSGAYSVETAFGWSTLDGQQWSSAKREASFQWTVPKAI